MKQFLLTLLLLVQAFAQTAEKASVQTEIGGDSNKLIIEAHGIKPETPLIYTAEASSTARLSPRLLRDWASLTFRVIQGKPERLSVEIFGSSELKWVKGEVREWAVRKEGERRFLDLVPTNEKADELKIEARFQKRFPQSPVKTKATTFGPADAAGFSARYRIQNFGTQHKVLASEGAVLLKEDDEFSATKAIQIELEFSRLASAPQAVELVDAKLTGTLSGQSARFRLTGMVNVASEKKVTLDLLRGKAAPVAAHENLALMYQDGSPVYRLTFEDAGEYPLDFSFVAPVLIDEEQGWSSFDFQVPGGGVVPLSLSGLSEEVAFDPARIIVPVDGRSFLPASGKMDLAWQAKRETGDGKLFYTSEAMSDVEVGAGLLRQTTQLKVKALQGTLTQLTLGLAGKGEILAVEGGNILSWEVEKGVLKLLLSRALSGEGEFLIRSQTALDVLPVKVAPLRLTPEGAVRHSGYLRISNQGAVRLEVMARKGLTQLSPDQYPSASPLAGVRQAFYYRYPSAERDYAVAAARVKPEINLSQNLVYEMTETDRILYADLELDIREAGIREWELKIPSDYSVVAVTGADVGDYLASQGRLKVIFSKEILGRRLVKLHLEKNIPAKAGEWKLPALSYPGLNTVRGEVGVSAVAGYRLTPLASNGLVEIPLAHFQKKTANLQQAYRIRGSQWGASMKVEALGQNVQAESYHLYSLKEKTAYVSVLFDYFVSGAPVNEWTLQLPEGVENLSVEGQDVRDYRLEEKILRVPLHRSVMGAYQLLVTYEQDAYEGLSLGGLTPLSTQGERGYLQVVSPEQLELKAAPLSENLVKLDVLELPAEYRLLSHSPTLGVWQFTARPFELKADLSWFQRGETERQLIEHAELESRISRDGGVVTNAVYYLRSREQRTFSLHVPDGVIIREVKVEGKTVTMRQDGSQRLIALPDQMDPNRPVRVEVRSSSDSQGETISVIAPQSSEITQLTTHWKILADSGRALTPVSASGLQLLNPVEVKNGYHWIAERALLALTVMLILLALALRMLKHGSRWGSLAGFVLLTALALAAFMVAPQGLTQRSEVRETLEYSLSMLSPETQASLTVTHREKEAFGGSELGQLLLLLGFGALFLSRKVSILLPVSVLLLSSGMLFFESGAGWFFLAFGTLIVGLLFRSARKRCSDWKSLFVPAALVVFTLVLGVPAEARAMTPRWPAASELHEKWELGGGRIKASATMTITGEAGQKFLLLHGPGVLTKFEGEGVKVLNEGGNYFVAPETDEAHEMTFSYEAPAAEVSKGLPLLTTIAAVRSLEVHYESAGWGITSAAAVIQESLPVNQGSATKLWLGPTLNAMVKLSPQARDVAAEEMRFYTEVENLFVPGPGVVDGRHKIKIRPSQGQVADLSITVPEGFTVGDVRSSLVGPWRFDPETRILRIELTQAQSQPFALMVETQRSLAALPAKLMVAPVRIAQTSGEVGMLALAFGQEAQLEQDLPKGLSIVNLADFNAAMLPEKATLQKVYRYSKAAASLELKVAPVAPEVRVSSKQKISLGDERTLLSVDFTTRISRAGIFRLSFPLPSGFEVESLTGSALNHWVEIEEKKSRVVIMNLNGKTLGEHTFHLVLAGTTPPLPVETWAVPKFSLREADRDSGQLVIVPGRGIQLQALSRRDVSALDPREAGGHQSGSLAYRLLQKSWQIGLKVDQLKPSISVISLQEVELREAYLKTRHHLLAQIDHASVRELQVRLPHLLEADFESVTATGVEVRDMVHLKEDLWEIQFKRRVVGEVKIRIDHHQNRANTEVHSLLVPAARKQEVYLALNVGSQLELKVDAKRHPRWTTADWHRLPKKLRQPGSNVVPTAFLRTIDPGEAVGYELERHAVVSGTKIRVLSGELRTIVSPMGAIMNQAELSLEVIQQGSLELTLPMNSRLFGVFVNEESAAIVRKGESYLFKVTGAAGGQEAKVRLFYSTALTVEGELDLAVFSIGEPLENIEWSVSLPEGYELVKAEGDFDLIDEQQNSALSQDEYLAQVRMRNSVKQQLAQSQLGKVSSLIQGGDNKKAAITLSQVSNQFSLDAASNEDARVQFENIITQQAVLGFNTRLQRNYLDNRSELGGNRSGQNDRLEIAANENPVFGGNLNFRPDDFQGVVVGNDAEMNRSIGNIAKKWVQHQRVTEPVLRQLEPVVSASGKTLVFRRDIQVDGEKTLGLKLQFKEKGASFSQTMWVVLLLVLLAIVVAFQTAAARSAQ